MNTSSGSVIGETRSCPHCKATILKGATRCPACQHVLRFDALTSRSRSSSTFNPLRVQGVIRRPPAGEAFEYSVILAVQNEQGEEIDRRVMAVGGINSSQSRKFTIWVEVSMVDGTE